MHNVTLWNQKVLSNLQKYAFGEIIIDVTLRHFVIL
jgi:hypothetical protein